MGIRFLFLLFFTVAAAPAPEPINVACAISLKDAFSEIAASYRSQTGRNIRLTFGSSGELLAQVKNGAPIDAFVSASSQEMDDLAKSNLIDSASRKVIATNTLVLIVPSKRADALKAITELSAPRHARIAMGDPATVPAGRYTQQAIESLGLETSLKSRLVYGSNVRQVLDYVRRGEVSAGIVYATDAQAAADEVRIVEIFPANTHNPIVYPAAVIRDRPGAIEAGRFLDFLQTGAAQKILAARGFKPPAVEVAVTQPQIVSHSSSWQSPLKLSLQISLSATFIAALIALPLAFLMSRKRFVGQSVLEGLITVPLVLPPTVVGYLIIVVLGAKGLLGQFLHQHLDYSILFRFEGAVIAAAVVALPLIYLPAKAAFGAVPREMEDTALVMGAGRWKAFWLVSIPLARLGIVSGLVLGFARALGEFGATVMVFGWREGSETLPISIYKDYEQGELRNAAGAVLLLAGISMVLILVYNRIARDRE